VSVYVARVWSSGAIPRRDPKLRIESVPARAQDAVSWSSVRRAGRVHRPRPAPDAAAVAPPRLAEVEGSHVLMLSRPAAVTAVRLKAAHAVG
jgi:hypothetical protein